VELSAIMKKLIFALLCWAASHAWAGSVIGGFSVNIHLTYREKCISESLSQQANALVQVVCRSGHFVSIDPSPGKPFLGTHGAAYRYYFDSGSSGVTDTGLPLVASDGSAVPNIGYGTVTGLRVFNPSGAEDPFEFLISF
jgi:hypothetical protein